MCWRKESWFRPAVNGCRLQLRGGSRRLAACDGVTRSGGGMKHLVSVFMSVVALVYFCPANNVREHELTRRGTKNFLNIITWWAACCAGCLSSGTDKYLILKHTPTPGARLHRQHFFGGRRLLQFNPTPHEHSRWGCITFQGQNWGPCVTKMN
jgi:hypothetical protein